MALVSLGVLVTPAEAYDNPELLPDHPTPVIDLAKVFSDTQRAQLEASLADVEERTGWKMRVLTQYERTPGLAIREFWGCLLYTSPSPRDRTRSRMPSSA